MMSCSNPGALDLSRLTDEEAKHVWQVIQRDFNLRKKEEDRLGELKTKIEKEDTKRELLVFQPSLTDSLCIRCLQPFKFLVNSKRQCIDCKLHFCKSCSRYNKKEHGWVCDPCRMTRVLRIGTLEWYHENVRSRFKRFGSAKVMRSLYKRLNGERTCSQTDLREHREDDTHSMPEVHSSGYGQNEDHSGALDRKHNSLTRKSKRLLSVDPLDFNLRSEYSTHSRRHSFQYSGSQDGVMQREADLSSLFKPILVENGNHGQDDYIYSGQRIAYAQSFSKTSQSSASSANCPPYRELPYSAENSDEEDSQNFLPYNPPRRSSGTSSPDGVPPQIIELNRRLSVIESLLSRLEQKITLPEQQAVAQQEEPSEIDLEELELRKKLVELTGNISDKASSSEDEEEPKKPEEDKSSLGGGGGGGGGGGAVFGHASTTQHSPGRSDNYSTSRDYLSNEPQRANFSVTKPVDQEKKTFAPEPKEKCSFTGTASELSQLEGKVKMAAARVQSTQSEVSDIESRIAALSAAGMTVESPRRRASTGSQRRLSHDCPIRSTNAKRPLRKLSGM
ncbi:melanophilin [Chanos chanos]|uniref:Melanophilin n=1 Tax=Chanos chanos TaxID=29144 RepID=A0A6J2WAN8_CHACN|nr:melanophilin-like [Chanos chanos]